MELDLTPKKYRKKASAPRRRFAPTRIAQNWKNPFQIALLLVTMGAFVGSIIVGHIRDARAYGREFAVASAVAERADRLIVDAAETYETLQAVAGTTVLKMMSDEEHGLRDRLSRLDRELDDCFRQVDARYAALPPRYQGKVEVLRWFIGFAERCIDSELSRGNPEQARLWYNASHLNTWMMDVRARIEGRGAFEIAAEDCVEMVEIFPLKSDGPRIVPDDPLFRIDEFPASVPDLPPGSYLLWATTTNGAYFTVPAFLRHNETRHVELSHAENVPDGMAYVPKGPFVCGGDESPLYRMHDVELPAFYIGKREVTVAEYLAFWNTLADPETKAAFAGRIVDERIDPDFPVVGISLEAAMAYCDWLGGTLGKKVRLPTAFEWEKAARGADDRTYPWGYGFEPDANLALCMDNPIGKEKYALWAPPGSFRRDVSVFDVYDMAGNVRELTSTPMPGHPERVQIKGGSALTSSNALACAFVSEYAGPASDVGFRYVIELEGTE